MTAAAPVEIEFTDLAGFEEPSIPCDGPRIWPEVLGEHDDPAEWIGVKNCGHSRLFCTACKDFYMDLMEESPYFTCRECKVRSESKFIAFEPLGKMS